MTRVSDSQIHSEAYHSRRYTPPDPLGIGTAAIERCRKRLAAFDRDVTIWWASNAGCWRVMQWLETAGVWDEIFRWHGPQGEYRDIGSPDAIIRELQKRKITITQADKSCEDHNAELSKKKEAESDDLRQTNRRERRGRYQGIQAHFSMSDTTPRKRAEVLRPEIDPEYVKVQRKRGNTRYGYE